MKLEFNKSMKWALCTLLGLGLVLLTGPAMASFYSGWAPILMLPIGSAIGWCSCCIAECWSDCK